MRIFTNYLKEKKTIKDIINVNKAEMYENLFKDDNSKTNFLRKKVLPYGWHWLYFSENYSINQIGADGHPKRGIFFPKFQGCKRMFAGSKIKFIKDIKFNDKVTKVSKIKKIENKGKENTTIYFLHINHLYKVKNQVVLEENQNLVFINQNYKTKRKVLYKQEKEYLFLYKKKISFSNVLLFRYSSITYNSHRIHYDVGYTRREEGYKDLLVHGPLLATVALDEFRQNINYKLTDFEFRMFKPVLVNEEIHLKIFKNIQNKKEFKIIFTCFKKKEVKFIAFCKRK